MFISTISPKLSFASFSLLLFLLLLTCEQIDFDVESGPSITLLGPDPYIMNIGGSYIETGATAYDAVDGDITGDIAINDDEVIIDAEGSYAVIYSVTNTAGEEAVKERTVKVQDIQGTDWQKPVITLKGSNPQIVYAGQTYTDPGATAYDDVDGDLTKEIKIFDVNIITTTEPDTFLVWYMVEDKAGNVALEKRTVIIVKSDDDTQPPKITLNPPDPVNLIVGGDYEEPGATAWDDCDGDLTDALVIDSSEVNTSEIGTYSVTYTVSDKAGNKADTARTVRVMGEDSIPPVLTLLGDDPLSIGVGDTYTDPGATALDEVDGDLTDSIVIDSSNVNTATAGTYTVTYTVSDKSGNTADTTRTVNVVEGLDTKPPVITLKGANPMDVIIDNTYYEPGATAIDNIDGDLTDSIVIDKSNLNTKVAGSYTVTYTVSDAAGNRAEKGRTVNVIETGDTLFVEDFEIGRPAQTTLAQKNFGPNVGYWYGSSNGTSTTIDPDPIADPTFTGVVDSGIGYNNSLGLHVTITLGGSGNCFGTVGFNLKETEKYYNLGNMRNFKFRAKGSGTIRVVFFTQKVLEWPNSAEAWGHFGKDITLKTDWTDHKFPVSDIKPVEGSPQAGIKWDDAGAKDKVTAIGFEVSGDAGTVVEMYLDDIKMEGVKVSDFQ